MYKLLLFGTLFLLSSTLFGQIHIQDSMVQVIGYWSKQDTQSYAISYEKIKIKNKDTISRELMNYEVDITILDSTANSYTKEWFIKTTA